MSNYGASKNTIEKIRNTYGEVLFRTSISHLIDVGIRHLDKEMVEETCTKIMQEDDTNYIMSNEFKCDILRCAYELAQVPHIDLLVYIQREVVYDVFDDGMNYSRALQLLGNCANWIEMQYDNDAEALDMLDNLEFEEDDLRAIGLDYLIKEDEGDA